MTLKELTYEARQCLQTELGVQFKQAHIYELLAAAYGFKSWAAFSADAVLLENWQGIQEGELRADFVRQRCQKLGYSAAAAEMLAPMLFRVLQNRKAVAIRVSQLLPWSMDWDGMDWDVENDFMQALKTATDKDNAAVHVVLAEAYAEAIRNSDAGSEGVYWWQQSQSGRALTGAEKEWADSYASYMERKRQVPVWKQQFVWHLKEALRLCEQTGGDDDMDWMHMWSLADDFELSQEARQCLEKAAERGNVSAMREWIDEYGATDVCKSWVLFFLAQMLGTDLTATRTFAIGEDGEPYDSDFGGPCFVDEYPGVELPVMGEEQKAAAKLKAEALFQAIEQRKARQKRNAEIRFRKIMAELDSE